MRSSNIIRPMAVLMGMTLLGACNQGPNPKDRVSRELKDANIKTVDVDYDSDAKVVHLKGAVDSSAERVRAEEIAHKAVGTSGAVANELTVKGVNDRTADEMDSAIRRELNAKVGNDRALEHRDIKFTVNNGVVTITGEVRNEAEKDKVKEMTRSTENVKEVVDALKINHQLRQPEVHRTGEGEVPERHRYPDRESDPARR
jgi:osmotically-inducible protein OsmY